MEKKCNGCKKIKPVSEFGKESRAKNGYKPRCKMCMNKYYNAHYENWKEKKRKYAIDYFKKNRDEVLKRQKTHNIDLENRKTKQKIWREQNREYINKKQNEWEKEKVKNDAEYRAIKNMRKLIYRLKIEKRGRTSEILGYTVHDLKNALGRLPEINESIDHKIPVTWFVSSEFVREINSLENLQILSINENSKKNNRYSSEISLHYYNQIKHLIKPQFLNQINTYGTDTNKDPLEETCS